MSQETIPFDISSALFIRLGAFEGINSDRIAYPEYGFVRGGVKTPDPPADGLWVETYWHALEPENDEIGLLAPARREGWLQMVVVTRKGAGIGGVLNLAGKLAAHFPLGADYTHNGVRVRITKTPGPSSPYADDGFIRCPIKVRYKTYA